MSGKKVPKITRNALADTVSVTAGTGAITVKSTDSEGSVSVTRGATTGTGNIAITSNSTDCWTCLDLIRINNLGTTSQEKGLRGGIDKTKGFLDINIKSIAAGEGVTLLETPTSIVISAQAGGSSDALDNARNNPGEGLGVFDRISDNTAWFRKIRAGNGLQLSLVDNVIVMSSTVSASTGDVVDAANLGSQGVGLFVNKQQGVLGFRNLRGSSRIQLQQDDATQSVAVDVIESGIDVAKTSGLLPANRVTGLHRVAVTGSWNDLTDKPTWPTRLRELLDVSGTPTAGQVLTFTGTRWEPSSVVAHKGFSVVRAGGKAITASKPEDTLDAQGDSNISVTAEGSLKLALTPTTVVAGTYTNSTVTVDQWGRITAASQGTAFEAGVTSVDVTGGSGITAIGGPITSEGSIEVSLQPVTPAPTGNYTWANLTVDQFGRVTAATSNEPPQAPELTSRIIADEGLVGGGVIAEDVHVGLGDSGVAAGSYSYASITVDKHGRVTQATANTVQNLDSKLIAGEGLVGGGSITQDVTIDLEPSGVAAGVFKNATVTVDKFGRITSASEGASPVTKFTATGGKGIAVSGSPIVDNGTLSVTLSDTTVVPGTYTHATVTVDAQGRITTAASGTVTDGTVKNVAAMGGNGITVSGSPITSSGTLAIALSNTAVAPGTYTFSTITVDAQGRITAASSGAPTAGTVRSVAATGSKGITVSGSPITDSGTLVIALSDTSVTPGDYYAANISVDAQGRVIHAETNELGSAAFANRTDIITGFTPNDTDVLSFVDAEQRYLNAASNLSDLTNVKAARVNLGLGEEPLGDGSNLPGIRTDDETINNHTNSHLFAVAVSTNSSATGPYSAVMASENSSTSASKSAVIASIDSSSAGQYSLVMASNGVTASGQNSAVIASNSGSSTAGALNTLVAASSNSRVGSAGQQGVVIASSNTTNNAPNSVALASNRMILTQGVDDHTVTLGANTTTGASPSTANRKIQLNARTGEITAASALRVASFSDFAEYFINVSGNPIALGVMVTLRGDGVVPATPGDIPVGVVSATAGMILGDTPFQWQARYLTGDHGETLHDADGNPIENPQFDPNVPNVPRSARPSEWTLVGLVGQIHVNVDATVTPGSFVKVGDNHLGVHSDAPTAIRVMRITRTATDKTHAIALCLVK